MKQKQRLFFILLFVAGLGIGLIYFKDFLSQHPHIGVNIDLSFGLLIGAAIIIQLAAHWVRAYKSRYLLNNIRPAPTPVLFKGLSVGFLFNTLLPLRLGEVIRAFYVGDALAISKTAVFISIIIERLVDSFILGLCFLTAGGLVHQISPAASGHLVNVGLGLIVVSLVLSALIFAIRSEKNFVLKAVHSLTSLFNTKLANRMRFMAWSGIYGTRSMLGNQKRLMKYLGASIGMWVLYFGSTALVAVAYFEAIAPSKLWFVAQSTYAGVSAPAGPGYIGTFHIIVTRLLSEVGLMAAGGFALLIWLVMVAPISMIGVYVLVRQRFDKKPAVKREHVLVNKLYREHNISEELGNFLDAYFKGERLNQILTHAELEDKFKLIKSFRGGSHAHTMLVWQDKNKRVKKIALPQHAEKLEAQAEWLIERAGLPHIPEVVGQEKTEHHYYFDLAYREEFYPFFDYIHSHSSKDSFKILNKVLRFLNRSIYKEQPSKGNSQNLLSYIDSKVIQKATDTASMSNTINKLIGHEQLNINGSTHRNLLQVIERIKKNKQAMKDLASYQESPIHGDLTIDNLIVTNEGDFLLLDPNNENQVSAKIVDLGKLYQSLHSGYEFLIQLESCIVKQNLISFEDAKSHKYAELFRLVDKKLKKELSTKDYNAILFHEAVHYCRMLTYRVNLNPATVPVFYATAVKLFNEFAAQYE